jgi:endonuclease/exonuclease/phosphatase family metal-dependent hydrolase
MALPLKGARRGHPWLRGLWPIAVLIPCLGWIASAALYPAGAVAEPAGEAAPARVTAKPEGTLRILTWNVLEPTLWERLAGALGLESVAQARVRRVNQAVKQLQPDVIALQEVGGDFPRLLGDDPDGQGVSHTPLTALSEPPGGLVLLSRYPIIAYRYRKLASPAGRHALFATVSVDGHEVTFANVHLESPLESRRQRERQLLEIDGRLDSRHGSVWLGDFNFGDQDPEQRLPLLSRWADGWARLHPTPAVTYDLATNPLARANAFAGEPSRRLDRILLSPDLTPLAAGLVGQAAAGESPPSDHYGVWVDVRLPGGTLQDTSGEIK